MLFFLLWCLGSAHASEEWHQIVDRSGNDTYRMQVPQHFKRKTLIVSEDTRLPIAEFAIDPDVLITIHNFPGKKIAPDAQVARWKAQFDELESEKLTPQHFGGFVGWLYEAQGKKQAIDTKVMGWAMELAPQYSSLLTDKEFEQRRSDFTIKIVGSPENLQKYRNELMKFAQSFELREELPMTL